MGTASDAATIAAERQKKELDELREENEKLRAHNEKLTNKIRSHRERARAALDLAEKTAGENAKQIVRASADIATLKADLKAANVRADTAVRELNELRSTLSHSLRLAQKALLPPPPQEQAIHHPVSPLAPLLSHTNDAPSRPMSRKQTELSPPRKKAKTIVNRLPDVVSEQKPKNPQTDEEVLVPRDLQTQSHSTQLGTAISTVPPESPEKYIDDDIDGSGCMEETVLEPLNAFDASDFHFDSNDLQRLLQQCSADAASDAGDRIALAIRQGLLTRSDVVKALDVALQGLEGSGDTADTVTGSVVPFMHMRVCLRDRISVLASVVSRLSERDLHLSHQPPLSAGSVLQLLYAHVSQQFAQKASAPISTKMSERHICAISLLSLVLHHFSAVGPMRVLVFDVVRLHRQVETAALATVCECFPDVLSSSSDDDLLGTSIRFVLAEAFGNAPDVSFDLICNSCPSLTDVVVVGGAEKLLERALSALFVSDTAAAAASADQCWTDVLSLSDSQFCALRCIELLCLSQGWGWTCAHVLAPLWQHVQSSASLSDMSTALLSIGVVARDGRPTDCAFFASLLVRLQHLLEPNARHQERVSPVQLQVAVANALVLGCGGHARQAQARAVFRWFVSIPESERATLPDALRTDIQCIGRNIAAV